MKKRILSIVLAIAMLATLVPVGIFVSADAPQEFSTWDEIANAINMNYGEGSYKLTADSAANISVDGFFGTFDGGNHTITASTTLFYEISGGATIKNFTVNQAKDENGKDVVFYESPVACLAAGSWAEAPIWISGVTNNVNVSEQPEYQRPVAGILGYADSENWIYIYDVVNNGDMYSTRHTGGIVGECGYTFGHTYLTIVNAVNNGDVFAYNSYAGGIVGNVNAQLTADFRYCINNGNVYAENNAGGILAQVNGKADVKFSYCANSGIIDQNPIINTETGEKLLGYDKTGAKYGVAGICPRFSNSDVVVTMDNCVVMGVLDNDSTDDGSAYSSADPFNAWNRDGAADITITNSSYLVGMNAIGEYAATLQDGATGFAALGEAECQEKLDAIVADAPNQPAPEIEIPELTPVDLVNVNGYVAPTVGADIAESLAGLTVPEGANYSISGAYWYNETLGRNESDGVFLAGCIYHLRVLICVASGYVFADDLVMQINGDASLVDSDRSSFDDDYAYLYSVTTQLEGETPVVDTVNVNGYVAPTAGADIAENLAGLSVPEGANYSINPYWRNETLGRDENSGPFISGCTYRLNIRIYTNSGCVFANDLVMQFNGDASLVDTDKSYSSADYAYLYSVTTQLEGEIPAVDTVNVNGYVAPTVGADIAESLAGITAPDGALYKIYPYWYNETFGEYQKEGTFIAGYTYRLNVDVYLYSGCVFADEFVIQFNGDASLVDLERSYFGEDHVYIYSVATLLEGEVSLVDTVNVNGYVAPTAGTDIAESLAGLSVPEGAPYSISYAYWYNETIGRNEDSGTVIAGCTYRLRVTIRVASGYLFADELVMQINGDASLADLGYSYSDKADVRLYSVATQLEGEIPTVDTVNVNGYVAPTVGADIAESLAGLTVPEGAPYSIDPYWYNETLGRYERDGSFIAGCTYRLNVDISIDSGYIFADDLVMQLNGNASLVDLDYDDCYFEAGYAYIYSVATEPSAPAEFFTFASGADTTCVSIDETNGHLVFKAGAMKANDIIALFADTGVSITKANGNAVSETAKVGTTCIITSTINGESKSLTVVVIGDLTGDGNINALDCTKCALQVKGEKPITDPAVLVAANALSNSDTINALDVNRISLFFKGTIESF